MATREENLKKINAELEQLSDEELEKIAGGTSEQMVYDSRFLNTLTGMCDRYGDFRIMFSAGVFNERIEKAWAYAGVEAHLSSGSGWFGKNNTYKRMDNGQPLTQKEAREYAMNYLGRHLTDSEWGKGGSW